MRGDPEKLIQEFAKEFSLTGAMDAAGYRGHSGIYEAAQDIQMRADLLRQTLGGCGKTGGEYARILAEYEKIAFSDDENIKVSDRLRALEMYRAMLSRESGDDAGKIVVNYDYGDEG